MLSFISIPKKYKFDVRHTKVECRFHITLKVDSPSSANSPHYKLPPSAVQTSSSSSHSQVDLNPSFDEGSVVSQSDSAPFPELFSVSPQPTRKKTASSDPDTYSAGGHTPKGVRIADEPREMNCVDGEKKEGKAKDYQKRYTVIVPESPGARPRFSSKKTSTEIRIDKLNPDVGNDQGSTILFVLKSGETLTFQAICNGLRELLDL